MKSIGIFIFLIALSTITVAQKNRTVFEDVNIEVEPVSFINSVASEISPAFLEDFIYFSGVSEKYFNKTRREKRNMDFYNIYSASIDKTGVITSSRSLVSGFDNEYHEGPVDYCEASGELFVTVSNITDIEAIQKMIPIENIRLRLVIKKRIDGIWQTIEELPFNDKRFHFAHPAISTTGDTLVFSSDLNSVSYGNSDLFMSVRKNGEWLAPVNLGDSINTPGSELFPTFIPGGILSFASNGRNPNSGGLDIYYTHFPEMDKVEIPGGEINTPFDDFGLIIHKNRSVGYFASNRNGMGSDDIFKTNIQKLYKTFNGKVTDFNTNLPMANVEIILNNCNGSIINKFSSDSIGNFSFEKMNSECLQVEILKEGYESELKTISGFDNFEFKLKLKQKYEILVLDSDNGNPIEGAKISCNDEFNNDTTSQGIVSFEPPFQFDCEMSVKKEGYIYKTFVLDPKINDAIKRDTVLLYKKELNKSFVLGQINSSTGELRILKESTRIFDQLLKIMKLNPDLILELGWHTDSWGRDDDNKRLSQNRADFAVNYIVSNGIEKNRIFGKGYGESQLLNKCKNGVQCTEDEHKENRRIEFKIIGFLNP